MIVDANSASDPIVITGSHNWSYSADSRNDENTVIFHDQMISNIFLQEFAERYHESGGSGTLGQVSGIDNVFVQDLGSGQVALHQNMPNPFTSSTRICFESTYNASVSLSIYDVAGRLVRTLLDQENLSPGLHIVGWDGTNNRGDRVTSGVYLCVLQTDAGSVKRKMVLVD